MKEKWIDLNVLPRKGKLRDWKQTIGKMIDFKYNETQGKIEILEYDVKTRFLKIKYLDKTSFISTSNLSECQLGNILGTQTKDFKIEVGTNFKSEKRDLTITDRKYDKSKKTRKQYKYTCNVCGWTEGLNGEDNLIRGQGCSCCCSAPQNCGSGH